MDFCQYSDAQQFLHDVSGFLERKEAENNLSLGILHSLANAPTTVQSTQGEPFLAVVREDGLPVLTLVMTPPNKLVIAGEGPKLREAVRMAVNRLASRSVSIPGVIGEPEAATAFVEAWGERTGSSPEIIMNQRIYKLEHVSRVPMSTGALRAAEPGDAARVAIWVQDFFRVISETISYEQALQKAMRSIETGSLYLWEDGEPVCMAQKARPTKNGIVVSLVYTPPASRGKGYATSCVAALSELLLAQGYRFCSLYTDLANPTSNSIYQKIGYKPVQDSVVYKF